MEKDETRGVRNKDIPLLTQIFYIMQDIRSLQHRSEFNDEQLYSTTKRLTGMPGGGGLPHGFDSILVELEEVNREYGEKIAKYVKDLRKAEKILNGITDNRLYTFVRLVYVDQVAQAEAIRDMELTEYQFNKIRKNIEDAEDMQKAVWVEKPKC